MKSYLLQPVEILPQTNIIHALWWIAFGRYPTDFWDISAPDAVDKLYMHTRYDELPFAIPLESLSDDICKQYGLPENIYAKHYYKTGHTIDAMRVDFLQCRYIEETTEAEKQRLDNEYRDFIDDTLPKAEHFKAVVLGRLQEAQKALFEAISANSIKIHGVAEQDDEIPWDDDIPDYIPDDNFSDIDIANTDLLTLSLPELTTTYITICGNNGVTYAFPCIDTKDLFSLFPPKPSQKLKINYIDGIFMLQDRTNKIHPTKPLGRPNAISEKEMQAIREYRLSQDATCCRHSVSTRVYDTCAWFEKTHKRTITYPTMRRILIKLGLLKKNSK